MLSDEEKKAIEWFREDLAEEKENCGKYNDYKKQVIKRNEKILNLIEKQSKEIEELKEDNKKKSIVIIEYQDLYEKLQDKIKAKIEELDNQKRQWIEDRNNKHKDSELIYAIEVLQSLLEKE